MRQGAWSLTPSLPGKNSENKLQRNYPQRQKIKWKYSEAALVLHVDHSTLSGKGAHSSRPPSLQSCFAIRILFQVINTNHVIPCVQNLFEVAQTEIAVRNKQQETDKYQVQKTPTLPNMSSCSSSV
jgi:hypothetical protein